MKRNLGLTGAFRQAKWLAALMLTLAALVLCLALDLAGAIQPYHLGKRTVTDLGPSVTSSPPRASPSSCSLPASASTATSRSVRTGRERSR